ncbi:hypothetical protein BH23ACT8_BH23ACT8_24530 [soil metagenome]
MEGWAHYVEELLVEEGFRDGDPRYAAGMAIEALVRVTRLAVSLGVHAGGMTMDEAVGRFARDAFFQGSAARSEAARATFDPTYGRYTWGKLAILAARDRAKAAWGGGYTPPPLPHRAARARRAAAGSARHGHRARLTVADGRPQPRHARGALASATWIPRRDDSRSSATAQGERASSPQATWRRSCAG